MIINSIAFIIIVFIIIVFISIVTISISIVTISISIVTIINDICRSNLPASSLSIIFTLIILAARKRIRTTNNKQISHQSFQTACKLVPASSCIWWANVKLLATSKTNVLEQLLPPLLPQLSRLRKRKQVTRKQTGLEETGKQAFHKRRGSPPWRKSLASPCTSRDATDVQHVRANSIQEHAIVRDDDDNPRLPDLPDTQQTRD
eukprot:599191-Hanusia_phi.AAC.8